MAPTDYTQTYSSLESVQEHKARALEHVMAEVSLSLNIALEIADEETESPIEAIFMMWWGALTIIGDGRIRELTISPQYQTRPIDGRSYRLDFVVSPADVDMWSEAQKFGLSFQMIGVEVDGHDFHERTKEQVIIRDQRDRDLQSDGWKILHFSGSELYRDPARVVGEVAGAGWKELNKLCCGLRSKKRHRGDYGS